MIIVLFLVIFCTIYALGFSAWLLFRRDQHDVCSDCGKVSKVGYWTCGDCGDERA